MMFFHLWLLHLKLILVTSLTARFKLLSSSWGKSHVSNVWIVSGTIQNASDCHASELTCWSWWRLGLLLQSSFWSLPSSKENLKFLGWSQRWKFNDEPGLNLLIEDQHCHCTMSLKRFFNKLNLIWKWFTRFKGWLALCREPEKIGKVAVVSTQWIFFVYFSLISFSNSLVSLTHLLVRTSSFIFGVTSTSSSILKPSPRNSLGTSCRSWAM